MKKTTLLALCCTALLAANATTLHRAMPAKQLPAKSATITADASLEVTPPEGVEAQMYAFTGMDTYVNRVKQTEVLVAIDGSDIYIYGLSLDYLPSAWVKGTLADGVATFPEAFMGTFMFWGDPFDLYFDGATFACSDDMSTLTAAEGYTTTAEDTVLDEYVDVTLTRATATPATPAAPEIALLASDDYGYYILMTVPATDVDGDDLYTSLLSYQLMTEVDGVRRVYEFTQDNYAFIDEPMTWVPYNYTDSYDIDKAGKQIYVYGDDIEQWTAIGAKSRYVVGDDVRESGEFWLPLRDVTAVNEVEAAVETTRLLDLQGRPVAGDTRGILLEQQRLTDGSTRTVKTLRK